jgi:membrane protein YdbS with pleckstrin-like domain
MLRCDARYIPRVSFSNVQLDPDELPRFEAVRLDRLSPKYAPLVLGVSIAFWSIVLLLVLLTAAFIDPIGQVLFSVAALPFFAAGAVLLAWLIWVGWKSASVIRYAVRDHDVIVQTGIFWRKETIQPIVRIQHVEQAQGPLEKRFGLYTLKLFSAGTGHVTFQIPGLSARTAARLKRFLLEKTQSNAASDEPVA